MALRGSGTGRDQEQTLSGWTTGDFDQKVEEIRQTLLLLRMPALLWVSASTKAVTGCGPQPWIPRTVSSDNSLFVVSLVTENGQTAITEDLLCICRLIRRGSCLPGSAGGERQGTRVWAANHSEARGSHILDLKLCQDAAVRTRNI